MNKTLLTLLFLFIANNSFCQELKAKYYLISNEYEGMAFRMHELYFENDSIVKEVYKLKCGIKTSEYKYQVKNDSLTIFNFRKTENKAFLLENSQLLNHESKEIYLTYDRFKDKNELIIVVEGDIWNGNDYESERERRKELNKFIKKRIKNQSKMVQFYTKPYDSYIKYGYVRGAIGCVNEE